MPDTLPAIVTRDLWLLIPSLIYVAFGLGTFIFSLWLVMKLCPFSIRKEIEEDQNIPLGIIMGALLLGIAIIIAAVIVSG